MHARRLVNRGIVPVGGLIATLIATGSANAADAGGGRPPNVVVILADDLGYADVGFQGCKDVPTPNIDSLAATGVKCTDGYVSCPVCSPTRAGLMTGRYQQRFGHEFNPGPVQKDTPAFGLPLSETTLPTVMKKAGYTTGMVGKWHLGQKEELLPPNRGFDVFFGFPHGAHSYIDAKGDARNPILRGLEPVDETEYLTDAFTREAVRFIDEHHGKPFFLYLPYNAVHAPMEAPAKYLKRFPDIADEKRRTYAAMLSAMDDGIGAVLGKLRELDLERDTLIFFLSDNGGPPSSNASRNDPLRGTKGNVYEGGIRVPFVVRWKGRLPEGATYDKPVISLDILPTAVAAAGGEVPADLKLDGVNLLPYLGGKRDIVPHETLYWRIGLKRAIRRGNLKAVHTAGQPWELYDLAPDVGETKDLASDKPEVVDAMKAAYASWDAELAEPRWGTAARPRGRAR